MSPSHKSELLAPAGDLDALRAALAAGADAVYFGLDDGFNARARAANFTLAGLADTCASVHRAGARVYLTLNTLVFEEELERVEAILRKVVTSGVDAIIVQDPAVALLARALCPALTLHASTQMTIANADAERFARRLGITRVVLPRELSREEIARYREEGVLEAEVFVHGALCVSWSGQCLTSEAWGGRSANRGQCAQSCRMPYEFLVDGRPRELGEVRYLLSPRDLVGADALPDLLAAGVEGLKIEGRQKGAAYVATAVSGYRRWLDALERGEDLVLARRRLEEDLRDMTSAYSRGFAAGFLDGSDHQRLVDGRFPKHRGHFLGRVVAVAEHDVRIVREEGVDGTTPVLPTLEPGQGVVFDRGTPEDDEPGGPLFRVTSTRDGWILGFGRPGPDLDQVVPGQRVWLTSDPTVGGRCETSRDRQRVPLHLLVTGKVGEALGVRAQVDGPFGRLSRTFETAAMLVEARGQGLDEDLLREKLGALGGTPFHLASLDAAGLAERVFVPPAELKRLRRAIVGEFESLLDEGPQRALAPDPVLSRVRAECLHEQALPEGSSDGVPVLVPLVRTDEQLDAVVDLGLPEVELDWMELVGLRQAVSRAKGAGLHVRVATLRVTKPGERAMDERLLDLAPDSLLVRHLGALERFKAGEGHPPLHGDFSLNVANSLTGAYLLKLGLETLTPSHDLDQRQLLGLLDAVDPARVTITLHGRMPTFHTEHCVYAHLLSNGRDYHTCGRPCEEHRVSLRDHLGNEHPVIVDAGCRNTVFHHRPQTSAVLVPDLLARSVRRFRVEFVRETRAEARRVLMAYGDLLAGNREPARVIAVVGAEAHIGVAKHSQTLIVASQSPGVVTK
ncbi:MAG: U32 family peptidase [Planctomycetes bacterium]|nr:U32 family peptidase [Planctomycetota bacterium]